MSLYERVPSIDLSPEYSDPPYSPFVLRDYARLLGDLFYFPQAVRDYVPVFVRGQRREQRPPPPGTFAGWLPWLRDNTCQVDFIWMLGVLGAAVIFVILNGAGLLAALVAGAPAPLGIMGWALVLALGVLVVMLVIGALWDGVGWLAPSALPVALAIGLSWLAATAAPLMGVREGYAGLALLAMLAALAYGATAAALIATLSSGGNSLWTHAALATIISVALATAIGWRGWPAPETTERAVPLVEDLLGLGLLAALGYFFGALRLDDYLLHIRYPGKEPKPEAWLEIARVSPLPPPYLHKHLTGWLDVGWQQGMANCVALWKYTGQQASVRAAMHEVLRGDHTATPLPEPGAKLDAEAAKQAERNIAMLARFVDDPQTYPWPMVSYARPSLRALFLIQPKAETPAAAPSVQRRLKRQQERVGGAEPKDVPVLPTARPDEALAAGFWHLEHGHLAEALAAFRKSGSTPQTTEMVNITQALFEMGSQENLLANPAPKLPQRPTIPFRPLAWKALDGVQEVIRFANLARQATTAERRTLALDCADAQVAALADPAYAATPETRYVQQLATLWSGELKVFREASLPREPVAAVDNPFLYAEPLRSGRMFVNRARELAALKHAWQSGNLQPMLIYGQPLVGKSSLLYAAERANPTVELAWFRLGLTDRKRMALPQVLAAVEQAVRRTSMLEAAGQNPRTGAPVAAAPAAGGDMYGETERTVRRICTLMQARNLVLVLDDFDVVASVLDSEGELLRFLDFVAHLFQTISNFTVVFVYTRPPAAFEKHLAGSFADIVHILALAPLAPAEISRLLRPPGFAVYFTNEACAFVNDLAGGHPFLAQLLGHAVVENFNRRAATRDGDAMILAEDVQAVLADGELVQRTIGLFRRVQALVQAETGNAPSAPPAAWIAAGHMPRLVEYGLVAEDAQHDFQWQGDLWRAWMAKQPASEPATLTA